MQTHPDAPEAQTPQYPLDRPVEVGQVRDMFDQIAPTYDRLNTILSLGLHRLWERRLIEAVPAAVRGDCLDLCTGTGALIPRLAGRFKRVVGADISPQMLACARARHHARYPQCEWVEADAQSLQFAPASFDLITVAYGVRNLPSPLQGLQEMLRVARPHGYLAVLEFGQPRNLLWRALFTLYSRSVIPLVGGLLSGQFRAYRYLPRTSARFPCGEDFVNLLKQSGWTPCQTHALLGGVAYIYLAQAIK